MVVLRRMEMVGLLVMEERKLGRRSWGDHSPATWPERRRWWWPVGASAISRRRMRGKEMGRREEERKEKEKKEKKEKRGVMMEGCD